MTEGNILSVSELTAAIKSAVEGSFPFVWVRGQVSNLSRPSSGHLYFSLRDEESSLAAVWFKSGQQSGEAFDPLTGEVYEDGPRPCLAQSLENGQEILCAGRITVYPARGVYQMVVEFAQKAGIGRLHEQFALLRSKLEALGYFAAGRKRPLPDQPRRIAVITAPQGAAVRDFLRIAETRGLAAQIRVIPAPVQGDAAPPRLAAALERVNAQGWAELVVLIRGGGSLEDLWAFNDEALAGAIFRSRLPVLAGIGHEVDFTLADMTADVRAATPSHAAQLVWPTRDELLRGVKVLEAGLELAGKRFAERVESRLRGFERDLQWRSPQRLLGSWRRNLDSALRILSGAGKLLLEKEQSRLKNLSASLSSATSKFPSLAHKLDFAEGALSVSLARALDARAALLNKATAGLERVPERLPAREALFAGLEQRLATAGKDFASRPMHALERAELRLEAANPHAPLERGYALVLKDDGRFVKKTADARRGERLRLLVRDGEIPVRVLEDANTGGNAVDKEQP